MFEKSRLKRLSTVLVLAMALPLMATACHTNRPDEAALTRALTPQEAIGVAQPTEQVETRIARASEHETILALSGGGADGAYSVGVLNGWTKTGTRPHFDIVTGVSTGALVSVFAFLGPRYDKLLRELYVTVEKRDIYRLRGLGGVFGDSLYDNTPLKNQIEKYVTPQVLRTIAQEHRKGRRLYVATTNIDAGELVVWDMGAIAAGERGGRADPLRTFQKILRASAALPVLFPPVYIKPVRGLQFRQAHVDGGVKAPVLLSDFLFDSNARSRDLYVIINGQLRMTDDDDPVKPNLPSIAAKSLGSVTAELMIQTLYRGYARALNSRTTFKLAYIPDDERPLEQPLEFDRDYLMRIYKRGERGVQRPGFWQAEPPNLKRYDAPQKRLAAAR